MGIYEVTQAQWEAVMGSNPSYFSGRDLPVETVSWKDAGEFCGKLSARESTAQESVEYRLPTEAEWEYACRAGTTTRYSFGDRLSDLAEYVWYKDNSGGETHPVGQKKPNPFGLYDMYGNVSEWCLDGYGDYSDDWVADPIGPRKPDLIRGGGWFFNDRDCRSAYRCHLALAIARESSNSTGFRVVRTALPTTPGKAAVNPSFQTQPRHDAKRDGNVTPAAPVGKTALSSAGQVQALPEITNSLGMKLVSIPPGKFPMGCPDSEKDRSQSESPQHSVTLTRGFYMGEYEVTQRQWQAVMGGNPSLFKGEDLPVHAITWHEAVAFCRKLSAREKVEYRLPTEAEWEYACRAGATGRYSFGDDGYNLREYDWYDGNSNGKPHPIGQKRPNAFGLFDMHGNISEWCQDWHAAYPGGSATDPVGPSSGDGRILRGGSWSSNVWNCRSTWRNWCEPGGIPLSTVGLRVAQAVPSSKP